MLAQNTQNPPENGNGEPGGSGETPTGQRTVLQGSFPNRRALLVSVNNYLYFNPTLYGSVMVPPHNFSTLGDRMETAFHIAPDRAVLLSDGEPKQITKPTKAVLQKTVEDFFANCREQDCALFVFAGHTVEAGDNKDLCLVPYDGGLTGKDLAPDPDTLVPLKWLYEQLEKCRARQKLVILDTCRANVARPPERPASNPAEPADGKEGTLWPALMQTLEKPPKDTQIWIACSADQRSYEVDGTIHEGVFLYALQEECKPLYTSTQYPEEPFPVNARLVNAVNSRMTQLLAPYGKQQASRLLGSCREGGTTYDPKENLPPPPVVKGAATEGGTASLDEIKKILADVDMPPISEDAGPDTKLKAEQFPSFETKKLADYSATGEKTPFRQAVEKARDLLRKKPRLKLEFRAPAEGMDAQFKDSVITPEQKHVARLITVHENALDELKALEGEKEKASPRWQANYLYVRAYLEMYIIHLYEYNLALGSMRKEFPDKDKTQNGWRLVAKSDPSDSALKTRAKAVRKRLDTLAEEAKETPWEVLARRDKLIPLGLDWQGARLP